MSRVRLVFDERDEGDPVEVECERMRLHAENIEIDDFVACPFVGFVHVHNVRVDGRVVYLEDCEQREHVYYVDNVLEVARPVYDEDE